MEEEIETPWWRTSLNVAATVLGLLALVAVSMMVIIFVGRVIDRMSHAAPSLPVEVNTPPPAQQNARTRVPNPYGLQPWPDSPARRPSLGRMGGGGGNGSNNGGGGNGAAAGPTRPDVPVGVTVESYREAVASGKKLYIPNPRGACDLSGANTAKSAAALDECFAQRVAR